MKRYLAEIFPILLLALFVAPSVVMARSLVQGASGNDVKELQNKLIRQGYLAEGKNTGYFGPLTLAAVKKFQCDQGIICANSSAAGYGIAGPKTQAALAAAAAIPVQPATLNNAPLTARAIGAFEFSGWVPYWRAASGTDDVLPHLKQLTSIMPFGYTVSSDGKLVDKADITKEPWRSFISEAKKQKVRVIPTVMWGNGQTIHEILSNTKTRIALEDEIAAMVKQNGFDGVDIDFEAKQSRTINYFSTFLKGLYQRMGNKWVYCTVEARMPLEDRYSAGAKIPEDATEYANDYAQMNKYCDRVEIMAYDQGTIDVRLNNARTAPYAPVADPGWVENLVNLAARSIPRNKLVIGIPAYGYEYEVTPLTNSNYRYKRLWSFNPKYAIDIASQLGITPNRTSANEIGFIYDPKMLKNAALGPNDAAMTQNIASTTVAQNAPAGQIDTSRPFNYLTWSDAQAIKDKIDLARKLGVRGVAIFSLGGAEDQAMWNILK